MKYITVLLCFFALSLAGQTIDTTYTSLRFGFNPETQDSVYYETTTTVYGDGRIYIAESFSGNSAAMIRYLFNRAAEQAREFARMANRAWQKGQTIQGILNVNSLLSTTFDTTIIQLSVDLHGPAVDSTAWDVISDQGTFTGNLTIAPSGNNLRMQIGGNTYTLLPVGDSWIRFQNVPTGSFTDLHRRIGDGKLEFRSVDESLIIRRQ